MKLVGGDSGRVELEEFIDQVLLAPSERAVVDVLVERPGELHLEYHTPDRTYRLATLTVAEDGSRRWRRGSSRCWGGRRSWRPSVSGWGPGWPLRRTRCWPWWPRWTTRGCMPAGAGPVTYACPMHPEVTSTEPGRCPKCGMKLLAVTPGTQDHAGMDHGDIDYEAMDHGEGHDAHAEHGPTVPPAGSSGRTTWSRSTASPPRPPCTGGSLTGPAAPTARPSTGTSRWASGSSSGW